MRELAIFNFEQLPVRIVTIDGDPWFVAADVASILGYTNPQKAVRDHCKYAKSLKELGERFVHPDENQSLDSQTKLIPESDIYRLVMRSKLPAAERFERWVMEELLPQLRQNGRYALQSQNSLEIVAWLERTFTTMQVQQQAIRQEIKEMKQEVYREVKEIKQEIEKIKKQQDGIQSSCEWTANDCHQLTVYVWELQKLHPELQLTS